MKKILILEDEEILATLYKQALSIAGHKVVTASRIAEAEKCINSFKPDIIFADHQIKGEKKTGIDFIKYAKKNLPEANIIMLTNNRSNEVKEQAKKVGAKDLLIKIDISNAYIVSYIERIQT